LFERLKFHQTGGQLLFHLISPLYERTSVIITTNLAFGDWPSGLPHRHSAHAAMAGDPGIITAALIENEGSPETPRWRKTDSNPRSHLERKGYGGTSGSMTVST
jgi:hypothetical protein